eukprot:jgi/Chlat1/1962/Chrsp158S02272
MGGGDGSGGLCGYARARQLAESGAWSCWLTEPEQEALRPHLISPAAWQAFLLANQGVGDQAGEGVSPHSVVDVKLQLRVRALLFDSLLQPPHAAAGDALRLDSMYHTLEHDAADWERLSARNSPTLAALLQKYRPGCDQHGYVHAAHAKGGVSGSSQSHKRSRVYRELTSLLPDVKPAKNWLHVISDLQAELLDALDPVLAELKDMGAASAPFLKPVKKSEAWDYYTVIKQPMDLGTMTKKLKACKYFGKDEFQHDIDLIVNNCREYNEKGSLYVRYANALGNKAKQLLKLVPAIEVNPTAAQRASVHEASLATAREANNTKRQSTSTPTSSAAGSPEQRLHSSPQDEEASESDRDDRYEPVHAEVSSVRVAQVHWSQDEAQQIARDGGEEVGALQASDYVWRWRTLPLRMELLAQRMAQTELPFAEQHAVMRSARGMAAFASASTGVKTGDVIRVKTEDDSAANGLLISPLEQIFLPEIAPVSASVPDLQASTAPNFLDELQHRLQSGSQAGTSAPSSVRADQKPFRSIHATASGGDDATHLPALRVCVAKIIKKGGFDGMQAGAVNVLTELLHTQLLRIGCTLRYLMDCYGNTSTWVDLFSLCHELTSNSGLDTLKAYAKDGKPGRQLVPPATGMPKLAPERPHKPRQRKTKDTPTTPVGPVTHTSNNNLTATNAAAAAAAGGVSSRAQILATAAGLASAGAGQSPPPSTQSSLSQLVQATSGGPRISPLQYLPSQMDAQPVPSPKPARPPAKRKKPSAAAVAIPATFAASPPYEAAPAPTSRKKARKDAAGRGKGAATMANAAEMLSPLSSQPVVMPVTTATPSPAIPAVQASSVALPAGLPASSTNPAQGAGRGFKKGSSPANCIQL